MNKKLFMIMMLVLLTTILVTGLALADDGPPFNRNLSRTPDTPTGGAQISVMPLYVPVQNTLGQLGAVEYLVGDCTLEDTSRCYINEELTMTEAKPLISTYEDGLVHEELNDLLGIDGITTGTGFGDRDAYASLSMDDGATWKKTNLSNSADKSSFFLGTTGEAYPGDVFRINHAVVGNRVAVAWISRFCETGQPLYSWEDPEKVALLTAYPGLDNSVNVIGETEPYQLYTDDMFGVAGNQGSVDYTLQGFPEVGEIPYGCVWAARGTLEQDEDTGLYDIVWRTAERLTSGKRDANRVDVTGTGGAGFIISWQEDPEGLRPGKGMGPGEGWSGAVANAKTDIWYTYLAWENFDDVMDGDDPVVDPTSEELYDSAEKPKYAVPFAVPMRLTDNNACRAGLELDNPGYQPYCYADFNEDNTADLCVTSVSWTNPGGTPLNVCQAEDGRVLTGRTASTRVRWALKPYTNDGGKSAWVVMAMEKMKAMGTELDENEEPVDIGKNMWYHTFDMFNPELVQQGLMLNSPAVDPETDGFFDVYVDEWGNDIYETEIARRFNLMAQGISAAQASTSGTSAILLTKIGILNQGGPADIFLRRVVLPGDFVPAVDNPFAYENVQCVEIADDGTTTPVELLYPGGVNPNYVRGLCPAQGMNVSGTNIVSCDDGSSGDTCAAEFPWDADVDESGYPKVTEWRQTVGNFNDPGWANPYDVSKGHRGFIDGDFVMLMYATAPNWKANTTGNEAYNLYVRRSFDGGQTWTTTPTSLGGDGTETCEDYGWGGQDEIEEVCTTYSAGEFEQARNVSRLSGSKTTVLDPRFSPTGGMLKTDHKSLLCDVDGVWGSCGYTDAPYPVELRDPSAYFVTFEVGDNTVVTVESSAVPMDMYYSRASNYGDDYFEIDVCGEDYPGTSSLCAEGESVLRWDWLEIGPEVAAEASVSADPAGTKFYAVWNQELEIAEDVFTNIDVEFRRMFFNVIPEESTEAIPTASILFQSADIVSWEDEEVVLIGSGRDRDNLGEGDSITNVRWWSSIEGHECQESTWKFSPKGLNPGWHNFSFSVQDNEGNWSEPAQTMIIVTVDGTIEAFMPAITK